MTNFIHLINKLSMHFVVQQKKKRQSQCATKMYIHKIYEYNGGWQKEQNNQNIGLK